MIARLLMTADAVGGVWTYALDLARALAPLGIETTLATMGPPPAPDQIADAAEVPGLDLLTSTFALEWMDNAWDDVAAAGEWLLAIEARVRPDMVHLNGFAHGALSWRTAVIVVGHSCLSSWREAVGGEFDRGWFRRYRRVVFQGIHGADWAVAPSATMLAALQRHYGPVRPASVVHNGRDPRLFRCAAKEPFVLTGGRMWDRAKNVAALRSIEARLSWPIVIAERLTRQQVADRLARAPIFALPARYEPFGLLPLEAALSGCALVLGDVPSLREVWGDAAVYVRPDDHDQLHAELESLIADAARRTEYAGRAQRRARRYTPEAMAAGYVNVYDAALANRHRSVPLAGFRPTTAVRVS